jgi:hypothetical protein
MAYSLKSVRYENKNCKILLQNENGPCPLLALANALLLKGTIQLPTSSIRTNVASIDDVVNTLAEHALKRYQDQATVSASTSTSYPSVSEHHIDEVLKLFPSLQYGLDVNPKFTLGPRGCEYTLNMELFDIMGVELVHGWLIDALGQPDLANLIGTKSYNQLVEMVILGNEAGDRMHVLETEIQNLLAAAVDVDVNATSKTSESGGDEVQVDVEEEEEEARTTEWVDVEKPNTEEVEVEVAEEMAVTQQLQDEKDEVKVEDQTDELHHQQQQQQQQQLEQTNEEKNESDEEKAPPSTKEEEIQSLAAGEELTQQPSEAAATAAAVVVDEEKEKEPNQEEEQTTKSPTNKEEQLGKLQQELQEQTKIFEHGHIVNDFLNTTNHQLTYTGLTELHTHVQESNQCVFFRNNHFCTMTKQDGVLFLLVTDLGYANVSQVVWEKLDDISGDTDYFDGDFAMARVIPSMEPSVPTLAPEQILAQRGQSEADYQLALELSRNDNVNTNVMDEREGELMAAATEASLKQWNDDQNQMTGGAAAGGGTVASNNDGSSQPTDTDNSAANPTVSSTDVAVPVARSAIEEEDRQLAMQLQADFARNDTTYTDEQRARELQAQEMRAAQQRQQEQQEEQYQSTRRRRQRRQDEDSPSSGCFVC